MYKYIFLFWSFYKNVLTGPVASQDLKLRHAARERINVICVFVKVILNLYKKKAHFFANKPTIKM